MVIRVGRHFATSKGALKIEKQIMRRYTPRTEESKSENRLSIAFVFIMWLQFEINVILVIWTCAILENYPNYFFMNVKITY